MEKYHKSEASWWWQYISRSIKQCKLEALKSSSLITPGTLKSSNLETISSAQSLTTSSESSRKSSHQASIKSVPDKDDTLRRNAGLPKNPRFILESSEEEYDTHPPPKKTQMPKPKKTNLVERESTVDPCESEKSKEESDDEELGKSRPLTCTKLIWIFFRMSPKRLVIKDVCLFPAYCQDHIYQWPYLNAMSLPVMLRTARARVEILALYDTSLIWKTRLQLKLFVCTLSIVGGKRMSKIQRMRAISHRQENH